jgi:hypothetical protein
MYSNFTGHKSGVPAGFFLPQNKDHAANNSMVFILFLICNVQSCNILILHFNPVYGILRLIDLKSTGWWAWFI